LDAPFVLEFHPILLACYILLLPCFIRLLPCFMFFSPCSSISYHAATSSYYHASSVYYLASCTFHRVHQSLTMQQRQAITMLHPPLYRASFNLLPCCMRLLQCYINLFPCLCPHIMYRDTTYMYMCHLPCFVSLLPSTVVCAFYRATSNYYQAVHSTITLAISDILHWLRTVHTFPHIYSVLPCYSRLLSYVSKFPLFSTHYSSCSFSFPTMSTFLTLNF
jgi:hypothetical protein